MKTNKIFKEFDLIFYGLLIFLMLIGLFLLAKTIEKKTDRLVENKHQLLAIEKKDQNSIRLQQDYYFIEKDLDVLNTALPNKEKLIDLIEQVEKEASESGIKAEISFSEQSVKKEAKGIKSIQFDLEFKATYFKMVRLIKALEEMPQIIKVEKIIIHSPQGIEGENNIILKLKCYIDPNF